MAQTLKVLGQTTPTSANTDKDLYTVGASKTAACSSLVICNFGSAATFRVRVRINGAAAANQQYLYYNTSIAANATFTAVIGISLGAGDVVTIQGSTTTLAFNLFGAEVS